MREIKFRAWAGWGMIMPADNLPYSAVADDDFVIHSSGKVYHPRGNILASSDYIVMQYTGLKDKNGVDIYEGDIVRYWASNGPNIWPTKQYRAVHWKENSQYCGWNLGLGQNDEMRWEVIGNIYENPELLETKQ